MTTVSSLINCDAGDANSLVIANNAYRDGSSGMNNTEESFLNDSPQISVEQRKMNAVRAYFEWMPLRYIDASSLSRWQSLMLVQPG